MAIIEGFAKDITEFINPDSDVLSVLQKDLKYKLFFSVLFHLAAATATWILSVSALSNLILNYLQMGAQILYVASDTFLYYELKSMSVQGCLSTNCQNNGKG